MILYYYLLNIYFLFIQFFYSSIAVIIVNSNISNINRELGDEVEVIPPEGFYISINYYNHY